MTSENDELTWDHVPALMEELQQTARMLLGRQRNDSIQPMELVLTALRRQRLDGQPWDEVTWANRAYFFGAMRRAMMRAFLDHVRKKQRRDKNLGRNVNLEPIQTRGGSRDRTFTD